MRISGRGISDEIIFYCQRKSSGTFAKGCFIVGGFKVFKGSKVSSCICNNLKSESFTAFTDSIITSINGFTEGECLKRF